MRSVRATVASLLGLIISLLLVGIVSGTILRHMVQITPAVIALALFARSHAWGSRAALPLFAFWLTIMILIWLFLLGIARVISGHFTPAEIALTVAIGLCSISGLFSSFFLSRGSSAARVGGFVLFLLLQLGALWLSMQPSIAHH